MMKGQGRLVEVGGRTYRIKLDTAVRFEKKYLQWEPLKDEHYTDWMTLIMGIRA